MIAFRRHPPWCVYVRGVPREELDSVNTVTGMDSAAEDYADGKGPGPEEPREPAEPAELPVMEGGLEAEPGTPALEVGARLEEGQSQTASNTRSEATTGPEPDATAAARPHANDVAENDADSNQEDVEGDNSRCEGTASGTLDRSTGVDIDSLPGREDPPPAPASAAPLRMIPDELLTSLSVQGVDRQLHDSASEQLSRLQRAGSPPRVEVPPIVSADTEKVNDAGTTANHTDDALAQTDSDRMRTSPKRPPATVTPPRHSNTTPDTHAIVRDFFQHYAAAVESEPGSGMSQSQQASAVSRRISRVGFNDFARDIGLLRQEVTNTNNRASATESMRREQVDDVFVRTLEQQRRELNSYNNRPANTQAGIASRKRLAAGLDFRSFHEATTELFAMIATRNNAGSGSSRDISTQVAELMRRRLGQCRSHLVEKGPSP